MSAQPWVPNQFVFTRGDDYQFLVHMLDPDGLPINVSGASQIQFLFKNQDNSVNTLTATQGIASGIGQGIWVYGFTITAAQTTALPLGANQSTEIKISWGNSVKKYVLARSLTVTDPAI